MKIFLAVLLLLTATVTAEKKEQQEQPENPETPSLDDKEADGEEVLGFTSTSITDGRITIWYYQDRTEIVITQENKEARFTSDEDVIIYQRNDQGQALLAMLAKSAMKKDGSFQEINHAYVIADEELENILQDERNRFSFIQGSFRLKMIT